MRALMVVSWSLWAVLLVLAGLSLLQAATERTRSPEVGQGASVLLAGALLLVVAALGLALRWAGSRGSAGAVLGILAALLLPVVVLVARPVVLGLKERARRLDEQRHGDFAEPRLRPLAQAILEGHADELKRLLGGRPPPAGLDRAGNDLLALAVFAICERGGGLEPLRVLLEAGADPRRSRMANGTPLVTQLILSTYRAPRAPEAVALLLDRGADPDELDARTREVPLRSAGNQPGIVRLLVEHGADIERPDLYGCTPVVHFTGTQQWDSAILLVERGARLDTRSESGLSLDAYLAEWRESVHGEHPEGWDRLRAAIARRREGRR